MRVLVDTNVIVDVLQKREPWFEKASEVFIASAEERITGCITSKQACDIHFFARKIFRGQEKVDEKARDIISRLFTVFEVIDTLGVDCKEALVIGNGDYEDTVMMASAARSDIDCIVTRNPDHFKGSGIKVYSPDEFVKLF